MSPASHIAHLASHFTAGRYEMLTDIYRFPLPVYLDGTPSVLGRPRDLWAFFQLLHARLTAAGLPELEGRLISVELPRKGRFRIWADWTGNGPLGSQPVMKTLCFNRGSHEDHATEMVQITTATQMPLAALLRAA
jgi:hypothetical protein